MRKSLGTASRAEAEALQRNIEADLLTERLKIRQEISVAGLWKRHLAWLQNNNRRPKTIAIYEWAIGKFFGALDDEDDGGLISSYSAEDLENYKGRALQQGMAVASVNIVVCHVRIMFERARKWKLLKENPFADVSQLKVERKVPTFLSREELEGLLAHLKDRHPPYELIACLCALCGFRRGEAGAAFWQWFDFERRTVTLASRADFQLKDWEARTVPLSPWALQILERYRPARVSKGGKTYVVEFPKGKRSTPRISMTPTWHALADEAGVPGATLQLLRRTFGSLLIQAGVSIVKVQLWMGHSSPEITLRHYAGLLAFDDDINRIGAPSQR